MIKVNLSWESTGDIDSYTIYRSTEEFPTDPLPIPIAEGITTKSYTDIVPINEISKYYYRIESIKEGEYKVSELLEVVLAESPSFDCNGISETITLSKIYSPNNSAYIYFNITDSFGTILTDSVILADESTDYSFDGFTEIAIDQLIDNPYFSQYIGITYIDNIDNENLTDFTFSNKSKQDLMVNIQFQSETQAVYNLNFNLCLNPEGSICENASDSASLYGYNIVDLDITVDVYVNEVLVASDVNATYINQNWLSNPLLQANAEQLGYAVYGSSSGEELFVNTTTQDYIRFAFVPKKDAVYNGVTYYAKDALRIHSNNLNPTIIKDSQGVVYFCTKGSG